MIWLKLSKMKKFKCTKVKEIKNLCSSNDIFWCSQISIKISMVQNLKYSLAIYGIIRKKNEELKKNLFIIVTTNK